MKKSIICLLLATVISVYAEEKPFPYIEGKVGYFFFSSSTMQKVYKNGGIDTQLSAAYPLCQHLRIYGSVEYLQRSGYSLGFHQKTSIWEIPLSLGLQPVFQINQETPIYTYFTLGPRYVFAHAKNDSDYVSRSMNANNIGGFVNVGLQFLPNQHFLIDLFGEYSYAKLKFNSSVTNSYGNKVQVGGFVFGGGLGYAF